MENPCIHKHQTGKVEPQLCHPLLAAGHFFYSLGTAYCTDLTLLSYRHCFPGMIATCCVSR